MPDGRAGQRTSRSFGPAAMTAAKETAFDWVKAWRLVACAA
jgi:hypothetical protein